eukprot:364170-Chlamydomonas_euryale.AAC.8
MSKSEDLAPHVALLEEFTYGTWPSYKGSRFDRYIDVICRVGYHVGRGLVCFGSTTGKLRADPPFHAMLPAHAALQTRQQRCRRFRHSRSTS